LVWAATKLARSATATVALTNILTRRLEKEKEVSGRMRGAEKSIDVGCVSDDVERWLAGLWRDGDADGDESWEGQV
jgi:hypothetical protein